MHAPDRLFSAPVNVVFAMVVVTLLAVAVRRISRGHDHRTVPMMGIMAAFVFAAQMLNFPVGVGVSGHLVGGTLTAILLGPWAGTVVMAAVVIVQAVVFQDGGITALGPNIFNMGVVGTLLAYLVYRLVVGPSIRHPARLAGAAFFAAWLAVALASILICLQLSVSGTAALGRTLPVMVSVHAVIGLGEGLITAGIVAFVLRTRPDLLHDVRYQARPVGRIVLAGGLGAALVCSVGLSLLPATLWNYPDGLESVGIRQGFLAVEASAADSASPITLAKASLAGGVGTVVMFVMSLAVGRLMIRPLGRAKRGGKDGSCTSAPGQ
jgi:cobalt/nickel transport system permease protein